MTKRAYFDEITKTWIFIDIDGYEQKTVQLVSDDVVKSLERKENEIVLKCQDVRKQARRVRSFAEEFMARQKREVERIPVTVQPKVQRSEPKLGERYREHSGHGVYSYVPSVKQKTATLVRDVLNRKVSPNRFLERLKWLTEEAMLRGQGS